MKGFFVGASVVALVVGLGWAGAWNGYFMNRTFSPLNEQVRRTTFEQSQSYVEGQRRDVQNLRLQWLTAATPDFANRNRISL